MQQKTLSLRENSLNGMAQHFHTLMQQDDDDDDDGDTARLRKLLLIVFICLLSSMFPQLPVSRSTERRGTSGRDGLSPSVRRRAIT
jgi:hypothetical protein